MVSNVGGYSRLAGVNEQRTLARLRGLRSDLIDPAIPAYHRRIVKRTGNGSVVEFERTVLLVQSSCTLVGFLLRALGFEGEVGANKYFAFQFCHPEKISQPAEVGCDRRGFELGGHVDDVTGSVERFPRHSYRREGLLGRGLMPALGGLLPFPGDAERRVSCRKSP